MVDDSGDRINYRNRISGRTRLRAEKAVEFHKENTPPLASLSERISSWPRLQFYRRFLPDFFAAAQGAREASWDESEQIKPAY